MTVAGAIALGLVLGALVAQRTSPRARTLCALAAVTALIAATTGAIAGVTAMVAVAAISPLSYLLRRLLNGRYIITNHP